MRNFEAAEWINEQTEEQKASRDSQKGKLLTAEERKRYGNPDQLRDQSMAKLLIAYDAAIEKLDGVI